MTMIGGFNNIHIHTHIKKRDNNTPQHPIPVSGVDEGVVKGLPILVLELVDPHRLLPLFRR